MLRIWEAPIGVSKERSDGPELLEAKRAAANNYVETASTVIARVLGPRSSKDVLKMPMLSIPDGEDDDDDAACNYEHSQTVQNRYIAGFDDYAEMYRKCHGDGAVRFHLCADPGNPGNQMDHADDILEKMLCKYTMKFKIGITVDPHNRWHSKSMPGYAWDKGDRWEGMMVVACYHTGEAGGLLERHLIKCFKHRPGCANLNPGGESTRPHTTYVYIVFRVLYHHPR